MLTQSITGRRNRCKHIVDCITGLLQTNCWSLVRTTYLECVSRHLLISRICTCDHCSSKQSLHIFTLFCRLKTSNLRRDKRALREQGHHWILFNGLSETVASLHFVADERQGLMCCLDAIWKDCWTPNTFSMAIDVIIILGSVYHLNRNPTCCIKHYHPGACHSRHNLHASTCNRHRKKQRSTKKTCDHFPFFPLLFIFALVVWDQNQSQQWSQ